MKKFIALPCLCLFLQFSAKSSAQPVLSIDINDRSFDPATNTMPGFSSFLIDSVGSATAIQTAPTVRTFGAMTVTIAGVGGTTGYDDRLRATPANSGAFTQGLLLRDFIFSRDLGNGGLDITIDGLTANEFYQTTIWSFDSGSGGRRVSNWSANGNVVISAYTFDGRVLPTNDLPYQFTFVVAASDSGQVLIQGRRDSTSVDTGNAASFGVFLNALQLQHVDPAPSIVTQPVGATRGLGDRIAFTVTASGPGPFSYQWFKDGGDINGATSSSLTLSNLTVDDSADYTVEVANPFGRVTSNPATLTVLNDPAPDVRQGLASYWPMDDILSVDGRDITPDLYSHNDMVLVTGSFFDLTAGQFGNALLFNGTDEYAIRDGGFPSYNSSAFSVAFWVNGGPQGDRRMFSESSTNNNNPLFSLASQSAGANGTVHVFVHNDSSGVLLDRHSTRTALDNNWHHVVWTETNGLGKLYIDGALDETDFNYTRGTVTLNTTTLGAILRTNATALFTGALDEVAVWSRPITFTEIQQIVTEGIPVPVQDLPPTITQDPASQSVLSRANVTFSFGAIGAAPLQPQWRKNGTDMNGETNGTLLLKNVSLNDAGDYDVVVANSIGSATSHVATLTVTVREAPPAEFKVDFNNMGNEADVDTQAGFVSFALAAAQDPGPFTRRYGGVELTLSGVEATLDNRKRTAPVNAGSFTGERIFQDFIFARDTNGAPDLAGQGMDIALEFLDPNQFYDVTIWSYDNSSVGDRISDWYANGALVQSGYTFNGSTLPVDDSSDRFTFRTMSDPAGKILIQGRRNAAATVNFNVFINALQATRHDLRIQQISATGGTITMAIDTPAPTFTHVVEQRDLVDAGSWSEVQNVTFSTTGPNTITAQFPAPAGTQKFYRVTAGNAPLTIAASTLTLTPSDGSGAHSVATDAAGNYYATFNDGSSESGTYSYTASGKNATVVLMPTNGAGTSHINLAFFPSSSDGTYTSDTVGNGFFGLTANGP